MMDIATYKDELTGLNGLSEHILRGVLDDPRWLIRWIGFSPSGGERTITVAFMDKGRLCKQLHIRISEEPVE